MKYIVLITSIIFYINQCYSQNQYTFYQFHPNIYKSVRFADNLDSPLYYKNIKIIFYKDSIDTNLVKIEIRNAKNILKYSGHYVLAKKEPRGQATITTSGEFLTDLKGFKYVFVREGEWYRYFKMRRPKKTYYDFGYVLKIKKLH